MPEKSKVTTTTTATTTITTTSSTDQSTPIVAPALTSVGVDISKDTFDVSFKKEHTNKYTHHCFPNNETGFAALVTLLRDAAIHPQVIMEASGPYYLHLATFLHDQGRV